MSNEPTTGWRTYYVWDEFQRLRENTTFATWPLREALQSDHLTPYVESRIRKALALLEDPHEQS